MRGTIGIAFKRNSGYGNSRCFGKPLFQFIVLRLACGQSEPPAIIVDHDADMIRVLEGCSAALEGGIIEVPFGRGVFQMTWQSRAGTARSRPGRARWQSKTGTTTGIQLVVAAAPCRLGGCRSDTRSRRRGPCSAPARAPR